MTTKKSTSAAAARRAAKEATPGQRGAPAELPPEVEERIVGYRPKKIDPGVWDTVRLVVVEIVVRSEPSSPAHAQHRMLPVARLAAWAHGQGVALEPAVLLSERVVEEWARRSIANGEKPATIATFRSILRRITAAITTPTPSVTATIGRSTGPNPYNAEEDLALRRAVTGQRTPVYRATGCVLYGLARGAGLNAAGIRALRRSGVVDHGDAGIEVRVEGRSLWVLDSHLDVVRLGLSTSPSTDYLAGGRDGQRRNIAEYISRFTVPDGTPHLNIGRCRSTWILDHLRRGTPTKVLADALGTRSLNQIGVLLSHVDSPDPDTTAQALRGVR